MAEVSVDPPAPPGVFTSLLSREFWSSLTTKSFWEDGCLGRSVVTGSVVSALATVHRYRNVKQMQIPATSRIGKVLRVADWSMMGFILGAGVNYYPCRKQRDEMRKQRAQEESKQLVKMFKAGEI